ncbi:AAA family ATPase [Flavobacterium sp. GT3R68]|uniref:AAA family ATPase n=1 Tax=Flavobacterium sp. GT3R68 TaxID=2594437 RepID=UPI000F8672B1|nr:AAA family ATPase [Flavobacterium sp. GT3R68]RTY96045.1 AAA family ATPase [Flavobacterium sp. GSN2]TRW93818.1 AAA family ATPase [Flavobacterium sp. GT3R68]
MKLQKAERHQVKLRIGLSGPSGFGKTYSALLLAYGITNDWGKIALIDTENKSASLYSHLGDFNVLSLEEPFTPERYIKAIKVCEDSGIEIIIIDSISHEWQGKGGCLEIHEQLGARFQDWARVTPRHNSFIDAILLSPCHVITTSRRKVDYSLDKDGNGKTKVMKLGTKEITREGFEYELTVNFELLNDNHLVSASKDRTGLFMGKPEFIINSATGKKLINWCNQGISIDKIKEEINTCETADSLKQVYAKYPNLSTELYPIVMARKEVLDNASAQLINEEEIIQNLNPQENEFINK